MSYNDGQSHIDFYDKEVDKEQMAEEFSEGDMQLKDTLLALWNNSIKTTACCKGHDDQRKAYLSLIINDESIDLIQETIEYLNSQDSSISMDFICSDRDYDSVTITMPKEEDKKNYLFFINNYLVSKQEILEPSNIIKCWNYLQRFAKDRNLTCRFAIDKDNMMAGFYPRGHALIFTDSAPVLDDQIDSIRETGSLPSMFKCSEKSLQELINIIYPNTFEIQNGIQV